MIKIRNNVFETNSSSSHSLVYKHPNAKNWQDKAFYKKGESEFWYGWNDEDEGYITINFEDYGWQRKEVIKSYKEKLNYLLTYFAQECLYNKFDETLPKDEEHKWRNEYLYNDYNDEKGNERWNEACQILNEYEETKKVMAILKEYDPRFKGFKYKWWSELDDNDVKNDSQSDYFENMKPETNLLNDITHPYWHTWRKTFKSLRRRLKKVELDCGEDKFQRFGCIDHESYNVGENDQMPKIRKMGYERFLFDRNIILIIDHDNH